MRKHPRRVLRTTTHHISPISLHFSRLRTEGLLRAVTKGCLRTGGGGLRPFILLSGCSAGHVSGVMCGIGKSGCGGCLRPSPHAVRRGGGAHSNFLSIEAMPGTHFGGHPVYDFSPPPSPRPACGAATSTTTSRSSCSSRSRPPLTAGFGSFVPYCSPPTCLPEFVPLFGPCLSEPGPVQQHGGGGGRYGCLIFCQGYQGSQSWVRAVIH